MKKHSGWQRFLTLALAAGMGAALAWYYDVYINWQPKLYPFAIIVLVLVLILAWNYIKLLFEAAERYVLLGVLVFTAPVAFSMGASQSTSNIFKSWCRMLGGQMFLLVLNAWCLRLFTSMAGAFMANPLSV